MEKFYIVKNEGIENYWYSAYLIDEKNPAPEWVEIIEWEDALNKATEALDLENDKRVSEAIYEVQKIEDKLNWVDTYKPKRSEVLSMKEPALLELAISLWINASIDNYKKDTLEKVLNKLGY